MLQAISLLENTRRLQNYWIKQKYTMNLFNNFTFNTDQETIILLKALTYSRNRLNRA